MKKPDAILTADLHIQSSTPKCREKEEFQKSIISKLTQLRDLMVEYEAPLIVAGDFGDVSVWPNKLISKVLRIFRPFMPAESGSEGDMLYVTPGQHDLPEHRLMRWRESALGVLYNSGLITPLISGNENYTWGSAKVNCTAYPFCTSDISTKIPNPPDTNRIKVLVIHKMILHKSKLYDKQKNLLFGIDLLKRYKYDLIVSGDNHKPFSVRYGNRVLVNPGSMLRLETGQVNHLPRVYLWYSDGNVIEKEFLKIRKGVIDLSFKRDKESREVRLKDYITKLKNKYKATVSFRENLKRLFRTSDIRKEVKEKIYNALPKQKGER